MLSIQFIRENVGLVQENAKKKGLDLNKEIATLLKKDEDYRKTLYEAEQFRRERNTITQEINTLKKAKRDATKQIAAAKAIPAKIKKTEEKVDKVRTAITALLKRIPNIMHDSVPIGKDDSENKELRKWGKPKKFTFPVKNHVELVENLGLADFDASAKTSGNGFYFLRGQLGFLNQALLRFTLDHMQKKGYTYIEPPLMLRKNVLSAALDVGEFAKTIYEIDGEELALIGTSEYSILGMHAGDAIAEHDLPKKYFAYSMCFRKEIGSHGINEKGLWRTHQFNKVEQFIFCDPEDSYTHYDELLAISEEIFQALKLPYRVVECCTGDLAAWKAKSADIEVWRPTTDDYGEVTSLSNCTTYQANDLGIKVIRKDGKREVLHTLNNTAMATSRGMVAVIENYQNVDGSITVPDVLVPYMHGATKITKQ